MKRKSVNIPIVTMDGFLDLFDSGVSYDMCQGSYVYTHKDDKEYSIEDLSDDKINELMKKSIQDKHNYLFEVVKDNPCPPLDKDADY